MNRRTTNCRVCGHEIAKNAEHCPHCGTKNVNPIVYVCLAIAIAVFFFSVVSMFETDTDTDTNNGVTITTEQTTTNRKVATNEKVNVFAGDCGISATAEMGTDIFGLPTVSVSITNTTDKDISAIKFYTVPFDVYSEEISGIFTSNRFTTDDTIAAGKSDTRTLQFLDSEVKTIKLYVYSVYFSDGTEWGDKDATKSVILKNALEIVVEGKSEK